jgi:hypothetical protein
MSGKTVKRQKRRVRKISKEIIKTALSDLRRYPFFERVKFCWYLLRGEK